MKMKSRRFTLLIILFMFFSTLAIIFNIYLNQMRFTQIPQDDENLGIVEEEQKQEDEKGEVTKEDDGKINQAKFDGGKEYNIKDSEFDGKIINIALLGGDRRNSNEPSHSDTIIILTIDTIHKKIKMSSIMRDTYVNVHKIGQTKITNANLLGGPALTIRTLNENFNLRIRDYVFIDFYGFPKLIDSVGGVEIDVEKYEVKEINKYIKEIADLRKTKATLIKEPGLQTLNGQQALSYSRIRYVGNGDYTRTERQRKVLDVLIKKISNSGSFKFPLIVASMLQYVETSMSKADVIETGLYALKSGLDTVEQKRFPEDAHSYGKKIEDIWYLVTNIENTKKSMHKFIYEK